MSEEKGERREKRGERREERGKRGEVESSSPKLSLECFVCSRGVRIIVSMDCKEAGARITPWLPWGRLGALRELWRQTSR